MFIFSEHTILLNTCQEKNASSYLNLKDIETEKRGGFTLLFDFTHDFEKKFPVVNSVCVQKDFPSISLDKG
jgi:hypothetical protein